MIWFFAFTAMGLATFAMFIALKKVLNITLRRIIGGTALLGICGLLAFTAEKSLLAR